MCDSIFRFAIEKRIEAQTLCVMHYLVALGNSRARSISSFEDKMYLLATGKSDHDGSLYPSQDWP